MLTPVDKNLPALETKFYQSPLLASLVIMGIIAAALPFRWGIAVFSLALAGMVRYPHCLPKNLLYEAAIADLIFRSWLIKKIPFLGIEWWHEIAPGLVLGGIPLENYNHLQTLKENGVNAVYAILEDFEASTTTFCSAPVLERHWQEAGISYYRLSCADMHAMPLKDLKKAAMWIHHQISLGKKVYVHCKAGRGRSAMVVAAYLMMYSAMSLKEAIQSLLAKRPIVNFRPCQFSRLEEFESITVAQK